MEWTERHTGGEDTPLAQARHNVAEAIRIIALRRWAFFVPLCLVATLAAVVSHEIPRKYRVYTVFERQENPVLKTLPEGGSIRLVTDAPSTVTRELRSVELMEEVIDRLGLTAGMPRDSNRALTDVGGAQRRAMASTYAAGVTADCSGCDRGYRADTIVLACEGRDPSNLSRVCNTLRDAYIRKTRLRMTQQLLDIKGYFEEQATRCRARIDELNKSRFQEEIDYWLVNLADPSAIQNRIATLRTELNLAQKEREDLQLRRDARQQHLERCQTLAARSVRSNRQTSLESSAVAVLPVTGPLHEQIAEIDAQIFKERKENRKTDKHPDVQELFRKRAGLVERLASEEPPRTVAANRPIEEPGASEAAAPGEQPSDAWLAEITDVEAEIQTLVAQVTRCEHAVRTKEAELADLEGKKADVFQRYQEHERIAESFGVLQQEYTAHQNTVRKLESVLTADENERAVGFSVAEEARGARIPSYPRAGTVLGLCLLLGVVAGVCGVLLSEIFDHSYHTTKQVARALGLAVLESIDEIVTAADRTKLFRRRVFVAPAVAFCLLIMMIASNGLAYLSLQQPDAYRRVLAMPEKAWARLASSPGDDREIAVVGPAVSASN